MLLVALTPHAADYAASIACRESVHFEKQLGFCEHDSAALPSVLRTATFEE
jgi:hypothetical protein